MNTTLMRVALTCAFFVPLPAFAVDFTKPIVSIDGNAIPNCPPDNLKCGEIATLGTVAVNALLAGDSPQKGGLGGPQAAPEDGAEKIKRWALALRIHNAVGDIPLKSEEVTLLKDAIGKFYPSPLVVGRAYELLDPASVK